VVDVQILVRRERGHDAVDDALERLLLLCQVRGPQWRVVVARIADAEQILAPAVEREPIAFEIEEEVVPGRRRQPQESVLGVQREHFVLRCLQAPRLELDRGLVAHALERFARAAGRLRQRRKFAEPLKRSDVHARAQLLDLQPADSGHEAEVVVFAPPRVALAPPATDVAMLGRLGIRGEVGSRERSFEFALHEPVVRTVVVEPVALGHEVMVRRYDARALGSSTLQLLEQMRVDAQLQDRACARLRRELGVGHFIRPRPELAGLAGLQNKIGAAIPALVAERRLIDDVGTVAHRRERCVDAFLAWRRADLDDAELLRAQVLEIRRLVLAPALGEQLDDRVVAVRPAGAAFGHGEIELTQMRAAQMIREVGRGEPQEFGDEAHGPIIRAPAPSMFAGVPSALRAVSAPAYRRVRRVARTVRC